MQSVPLHRIAFVGTYPPQRCGIATYTRDLREWVAAEVPEAECLVVPVAGSPEAVSPAAEVRFTIHDDTAAYRRAAEYLNLHNVDVVSLQHEYGIFGGPAGSHVLSLVRSLRMPMHSTLHTVLADPNREQREVLEELLALSARVAVMTQRGKWLLETVYSVDSRRIDVIPHGIPDMPRAEPAAARESLGIAAGHLLLTFGLLAPNKGIEYALAALPAILQAYPESLYVVLGATHPQLVRTQGEAYRHRLERLAADKGVADRVLFLDRFVELPQLLAFIAAADIYLTPYLNEDQITSGTLAYAFGCGKPVVSTPYRHAAELLEGGRGLIVPFRDSDAIAGAVINLLADDATRRAMGRQAWEAGRGMTWAAVARRYAEAFRATRQTLPGRPRRRPRAARGGGRNRSGRLPPLKLDHLRRLTDSTGIVQHATYDIPNLDEGYCTDDNARALTLAVRLESLGITTPWFDRAIGTYAAFLGHAFDRRSGRFRNLLGFDRRWRDSRGSDDCLGRGLVALGTCVGRSQRPGLRRWAIEIFPAALRAVAETTSPRAWALAIVGIGRYLERLGGDRFATTMHDGLLTRLVAQQRANADTGWPWLENVVSYENGRFGEALVRGGQASSDREAVAIGLRMLRWLDGRQQSAEGCFRPIGCHGFFHRGGHPAAFDQQPIEAQATVAASLTAWQVTGDPDWLRAAWRAFAWFHGGNELGIRLYDATTGGCRDGLLPDRANENQGAESTLAHLESLVDMMTLEATPPRVVDVSGVPGGQVAEPAELVEP